MNDIDRQRLAHAANVEAVRRSLIKYFIDRGFAESFDRSVNPIMMQDLPISILGLDSKVEIEPHAVNVDPTTNRAVLGWNMFIIGNQRIFLGETHHDNLIELARQIKSGVIMPETAHCTRRCTTPRRIVTFLERTLGENGAGYVDLDPSRRRMITQPSRRLAGAPGQDAQFMKRTGYGT